MTVITLLYHRSTSTLYALRRDHLYGGRSAETFQGPVERTRMAEVLRAEGAWGSARPAWHRDAQAHPTAWTTIISQTLTN